MKSKKNSQMSAKKVRSNKAQIRALVDFMSHNSYLAAGEITAPLGSRREAQWLKLKQLLQNYGPDRSVEQWKQTWKDLKKNARIEQASCGRVGGTDVSIVSEITKKILDTIGNESSPAIPVVEPAETTIEPNGNVKTVVEPSASAPTPPPPSSYPSPPPLTPFSSLTSLPPTSLSAAPLPAYLSHSLKDILDHYLGYAPKNEEDILPSTSHTSKQQSSKPAPPHESFATLQQQSKEVLQNIATLMAERNELQKEQNSLLREANQIAKKKRFSDDIFTDTLMAEQNRLLKEQNSLLREANEISRRKSVSRRLSQ